MSIQPIPVYMMPGMAASPSIFEHIKLPESQFKIHLLEWFIPEQDETLQSYAKKMCANITHDDAILVGVSFGGILVQEMAKIKTFRKVIVVSSVKSKYELPKRITLGKYLKLYKLLPTQLLDNLDALDKFAIGETITKRLELYKKYLSVSNKQYLDWSIKQVIFWDQEKPDPETIFINGDKDHVFPYSCNGNCHIIKGGTHVMILKRYKWFNENLPKIILDKK